MAIRQLHESELELAKEFTAIGQRHAADQDVYHTCQTLSVQCHEHAARLTDLGARYSADISAPVETDDWTGFVPALRRRISVASAKRAATGMVLLRDLRQLYLQACEVSILWVELGQAAQALRDAALLAAVTELHSQTVIQMKWATTRLKETAPIVLIAG